MGILLLSIDFILRSQVLNLERLPHVDLSCRIDAHHPISQVLVGAAFFTVVVNMKHIFVYMAPVYFVYILKNYCFYSSSSTSSANDPARTVFSTLD